MDMETQLTEVEKQLVGKPAGKCRPDVENNETRSLQVESDGKEQPEAECYGKELDDTTADVAERLDPTRPDSTQYPAGPTRGTTSADIVILELESRDDGKSIGGLTHDEVQAWVDTTSTSVLSGGVLQDKDDIDTNSNSHSPSKPQHCRHLKSDYDDPILTCRKRFALFIGKFLAVLFIIYIFICSLDLLSISMRLIVGKTAGSVLAGTALTHDPVVGLVLGCLVTVLLQSSSASTSVTVSMVAANVISVRSSIPIIMGANIGTSITNDIVALTQVRDRVVFSRAFGGACANEMFNLLNVMLLLPLEIAVRRFNPSGEGFLEYFTGAVLNSTSHDFSKPSTFDIHIMTRTLIDRIVMVDDEKLEDWAVNNTDFNGSIIVRNCSLFESGQKLRSDCPSGYHHLFSAWPMKDNVLGGILLASSLATLSFSLYCVIRIVLAALKSRRVEEMFISLNTDLSCCPGLTGYLVIAASGATTLLIQSSSAFTSLLTPLVGVGAISLRRMYEATIGANLGTTMTAGLTAFAVPGSKRRAAVQAALIHVFFNVAGFFLLYVVPKSRVPIQLARKLSQIVGRYRWFAAVYLVGVYLLLPGFILALSALGIIAVYGLLGLMLGLGMFAGIVTLLQMKAPLLLPKALRSWSSFVAEPFRSLRPYDHAVALVMNSLMCHRKK